MPFWNMCSKMGQAGGEAWDRDRGAPRFVSSNSWDVVGAKSFGFRVCWFNRAGAALDPLGPKPDLTVQSFEELAAALV